ncbi:replicative DNA helicase, partial [Sphingomonas sp.]|uniref:replicative DNA helicase n=1 Tax=Sphingomonas sp. TaxID=28214 RepID=UPI0035A93201
MLMSLASDQGGRPRHELANVETEAALLGALMIENRVLDHVGDIVEPEDFHEPVHGRIYEAIMGEIARGGRASPVTLAPRFMGDPGMESLGGPGYLAQLTGSGAGLIGAREFANQIADLAARRRLRTSLETVIDSVSDMSESGHNSIAVIVDHADAALVAATQKRDQSRMVDMAGGVKAALERIRDIQANEGKVGATTGIDELDKLTGGFEEGQMVVIAGRPGMGKTAVACSISNGLAARGYGVYYASLEMSKPEISTRMLADAACVSRGKWVPFNALIEGTVDHGQWEHLDTIEALMAGWPVRIDDRSSMNLGRITMGARRAKRSLEANGQKLRVVIVDYLQLMS